MTAAITRNQQKMSFAYDTTYQLTAEHGTYLSFERQTSNVECQCAYTYTAFGSPVSSFEYQGSRPLGFSTKEYDEKSGLSYYGFRYYDPASARWMNKDPLLWEGGMNVFAFVANDAVGSIDYYGLRQCLVRVLVSHGVPPGTPPEQDYDPNDNRDLSQADRQGVFSCYATRYNKMLPKSKRIRGLPRITTPIAATPTIVYSWLVDAHKDAEALIRKYWEAMMHEAHRLCLNDSSCDSVLVQFVSNELDWNADAQANARQQWTRSNAVVNCCFEREYQ